MTDSTLQDVQLMGRVAAGDAGAFGELYRRHASVVLGVLVRMLRRRELAEEILQEAFFEAWNRRADYRADRAAPRGWLLMLARSRALDRLRSSRARDRREEAVVAERPGAGEVQPVGTHRLESKERGHAVRRALGDLPDEQRHCIELAFWEGLTHTEIAGRLAAPLGTVKSRIFLGMKKLRGRLEAPSS